GPRMAEVLPMIEQQIAASDVAWPSDLNRAALTKQVSRGVYGQLLNTLPVEVWKAPTDQLRDEIGRTVDAKLIGDVIAQIRRAFCVGSLRARSYGSQEDVLVAAQNAASAWQVSGPAQLVPVGTAEQPFAELKYDFTRGDRVTLSQTFTTSFPVAELHRIQLSLRFDDTWHALTMYVEKNGQRFRAERTVDISDRNWVLATWQEPGLDDRLTKIRTWTLLRPDGQGRSSSRAERSAAEGPRSDTQDEVPRGPSTSLGMTEAPNQLKITIELQRRGALGAWWAKIRRNYRLTLDQIPFWRYVGTSVFLVALNLIGTLLSCSLVAYSFARLQWPGRKIAFALLLATMMVPAQVTMIPQFLIMQKLGWYNTLYPLWVLSFCAPAFYVFLLRQFLKGIPRDLEDAARLDGCGFLRIYWHIMLPLVKPALAVIAIFTFLATWNEFMGPLIYLADQRLYPLSFGLYAFQVQVSLPGTSKGMGMVMAGALLMTLPVIAMFFFAQRYFLKGVTLTGIKR
ncbi:MAG: carbohydrate ABC transporter permease, partial [Verrucomicrobiota bacterium]|nr:carbohydrate ABC transporter permease [Verrucomicrobiota bacterium]